MSSVIDASVLVAATTDAGATGRWAEKVVGQGPLTAPHHVLVEATNVLRRMELARRLDRLAAASAARDLLDLDLDLVPFAPLAARVWELRQNLSSYDAWYVALAEALDLPFATLDTKIAAASGPRCRFWLPTSGEA